MAEEILVEFKKQLITFFDELIAGFPKEGDLVIVRLFLANQISSQKAMEIFIHKINTDDQLLRKMVKDRNEAFFLEHSLFDVLGKDKVNHFKKFWRSGLLDNEDKKVIWQWIDTFVYLSDKYIKVMQEKSIDT